MHGNRSNPYHMSDRSTPSTSHTPLTYPWGDAKPPTGHIQTLMQGLHWIRMPLPFALNHINLWALDDQDEGHQQVWSIVDTGVATRAVQDAWHALWQGPLSGRPLHRVLSTHMHPDHVGNADWLIQQFSGHVPARLWMSATDHLAAMVASKETTGYGGERAAAYFFSHGMQHADGVEKIRERGSYYASMVPSVPTTFRRMMDGQLIHIGHREWRCIAGYGHSPEHIALYCEQDGVLISGDMLLPSISTNVSVVDMEPEADALGLFLDSLDRMRDLPPDTLALPSHGLPFKGVHARIEALHAHHRARLDDVLSACANGPATAADMLPVLFKRELDLHQTTFAMGEAIAHLNYLWHRGALRRWLDTDGVWRFERA